jgi:hypothetical protein
MTQKDAKAEATPREPGVGDHPDKVIGDNVFRWTGHLTFTQKKSRDVTEVITTGNSTRRITYVEDDGEEEVQLDGKCIVCGRETYKFVSGSNAALIGPALVCFGVGGANEPPVVYCQDHDPGREHRRYAGSMLDGDGKPLDGVQVRLK